MNHSAPLGSKTSFQIQSVTFRACAVGLLISVIAIALWVALARSTANAEDDRAVGRGFTGVIADVQGNSIIVQTWGPAVQLFVDENTKIEAPPDANLGFEFLRENQSARVAVLADREVTTPDGAANGTVITAKKIMLVPSKATRSHRRAVATENGGGRLWALDAEGIEGEVAGGPRDDVETGESLVLLVRDLGQSGIGEQVLTYVRSAVVDRRLERLANDGGNDPLERARLAGLIQGRESANEQRLERTADNANAAHRDMVRSRADQFKQAREASGSAKVSPISECAETVLGTKVGSFSELTEQQQGDLGANCLSDYLPPKVQITFPTEGATLAPGTPLTIKAEAEDNVDVATVIFTIDGVSYPALTASPYSIDVNVPSQASSLAIEAIAFDDDGNKSSATVSVEVRDTPPTVKITGPLGQAGDGPKVTEGKTFTISADVTDDISVASVVFTVNGEEQATFTAPPYSLQFTVPTTSLSSSPGPLQIAALATDSAGNIAEDVVAVNVAHPTAFEVRITQPAADAKITEGETLVITAETDDDSDIVSVTFTIDGLAVPPVLESPFAHSYLVPRFAAVKSTGASSEPPHVFVGTASINGEVAPDGTVVIAYVASSRNSSLVISAAATNSAGQTDTASLRLPVSGGKIKAGEGTVSGGKYLVNAAQPDGAAFRDNDVTFTVGGTEAGQSGTWKQGGANSLVLTSVN